MKIFPFLMLMLATPMVNGCGSLPCEGGGDYVLKTHTGSPGYYTIVDCPSGERRVGNDMGSLIEWANQND